MSDKPTDYRSRRYQEMFLVLFALSKMEGIRSKEQVLGHIRTNGWLTSTPQDRGTYDGKNESKSDTLLCYARFDAVTAEFMFDHDEKDCWQITRMGQDFLENEERLFSAGTQKVCRCFMWTPKFKTLVDASYVPSAKDWMVPSKARSLVNEYLDL